MISLRDSFGGSKHLKISLRAKSSAYNKFYLNREFKGLYWLRCHSSKTILTLNEYLNIYCVIISLRDSFGGSKNLKKSLRTKPKSF